MNIAVGCDHGGFRLKSFILAELAKLGHAVHDCGAYALVEDDDYPDFTRVVGETIRRGAAERGIIVCGSGVGASIAANKMHGIRAALCHDTYSAHQGVEDDDMNVICLGGRVVGEAMAWELIQTFLAARFSGQERHRRCLAKVAELEGEEDRP